MTQVRRRSTPLDAGARVRKEAGEKLGDQLIRQYREIVGCLNYLAVCTRPDLSQAVGTLARYMQAPTTEHLQVAQGVLRYLSSTADMGLEFGGKGRRGLIGYCDSDYAGDLDTRRSTTGFVYLLNGGAFSWSSRLQPTVAVSTTEAEYMAAAAAVREAMWIRKLLPELGQKVETVKIMGDNTATLKLLSNSITTDRSKHIDVIHHYARDRALGGEVKFEYVPTTEMVADSLTKAVKPAQFVACRVGMGVRS
jgi:hypothetical protein